MRAYRLLGLLVVLIHTAFVAFVIFGGFLVLKWRRVMWIHIPAAAWGAMIEFMGWICPLTPLENWLRRRAGAEVYETGFIEKYMLHALYPEGLTRNAQITLGLLVVIVNVIVYAIALHREN